MVAAPDQLAKQFGLSPEPAVITGMVYAAVSGSPNVAAEPPRLDCQHYFALANALGQRIGKRVRITIETLDDE